MTTIGTDRIAASGCRVCFPGASSRGEMADRKRPGIDSKLVTALDLPTVERARILHQL